MSSNNPAIGAIQYIPVSASSNGDNTVIAAPGDLTLKYRILAISMMASGTVNYKWKSNQTDLTGLAYCLVNSLKINDYCPIGWFETIAGDPLIINLSAGVAVGGDLVYTTIQT